MNIYQDVEHMLMEAFNKVLGPKDIGKIDQNLISVEPPRDKEHGDVATNVAMVFAKTLSVKPRDLAIKICNELDRNDYVAAVKVAGPGFINIKLVDEVWFKSLHFILKSEKDYGSSALGAGKKINIEYVSANPTGPLHAAHARGAVVGDALARLLMKTGYEVCKEYYINDAGSQVDILGKSTFLRYQEILGDDSIVIPEGHYPGAYLKDIAAEIVEKDGNKWLSKSVEERLDAFRKYSVQMMMEKVKADLNSLGIEMDIFSSEQSLIQSGGVDSVLNILEDRELLYEGVLDPPKGKQSENWISRPQRLFKSTLFGDDVDRAIQKTDGSWTYFASDIAYHYDKYKRGFTEMIDIWGADHGGYVKRMQSAVNAVTFDEAKLDVKICQIVHMLRDGKPVRMSKRSGDFITIEDVVTAVGKDVIRFIMLTRKNDQVLEFDFDKVVEQSRDNPVFYVQYAHARCCSVLRNANIGNTGGSFEKSNFCSNNLSLLTDENELNVIKILTNWPRIIQGAAKAHEPHRIAFYLSDLAAAFHSLWNKGKEDEKLRFIVEDDKELSLARLSLVKAIAIVIASGLEVIGIEAAEELRS
ncbi:MAG: arginine--tRNA ligase [Thalassobaculaceae bacterium]|tara:strand:- start:4115 stop:5869 length:1755 start_codon:yes stop_codon:yes gene_type:complete